MHNITVKTNVRHNIHHEKRVDTHVITNSQVNLMCAEHAKTRDTPRVLRVNFGYKKKNGIKYPEMPVIQIK